MRLINPEALIQEINKKNYIYKQDIIEAIKKAPWIEWVEAEWIESRYVCTCSHCGYLVELKTPFCPNCGVKMKGEYK